jgi:hypothetical protein
MNTLKEQQELEQQNASWEQEKAELQRHIRRLYPHIPEHEVDRCMAYVPLRRVRRINFLDKEEKARRAVLDCIQIHYSRGNLGGLKAEMEETELWLERWAFGYKADQNAA